LALLRAQQSHILHKPTPAKSNNKNKQKTKSPDTTTQDTTEKLKTRFVVYL